MKQFGRLFNRKDFTNSAWLRKHVTIDPLNRAVVNGMFNIKETCKSEDEFETCLIQACLIYEKLVTDMILAKITQTDEGKPYFADRNQRAILVPSSYEKAREESFSNFFDFAKRYVPDIYNVIEPARKKFRGGGYMDYDIYKEGVYYVPPIERGMGYCYNCNPLVPRGWQKG